jgi:GAF domain-containing protein
MRTNNLPARFDMREWRQRFILTVLRFASVVGVFVIFGSFSTATNLDRVLFISFYLVILGMTLLPAPYVLRAHTLLFILFAVGVNSIIAWGPWLDGSIFLLIGVVMASLLLDNRTDVIGLVLSLLFMIALTVLNLTGEFKPIAAAAPETVFVDWIGYIVNFSAAGIISVGAINQFKNAFLRVSRTMEDAFNALKDDQFRLEEKVRERTEELETRMGQLRTSTTTARAVAESQNVNELLAKAANLIAERFSYYHTGVFVIDNQRRVGFLQAASSETGRALLGTSFRIEQDRKNPLNVVIDTQRTLITHDLDRMNFTRDANYPLTRSRMVMPLAVRGEVIGLLDIHSDQPRAFNEQDSEILQTLADLTAISFDNARLLEETRNLLAQLEASTSLQTQRTWSKFTSRQKSAFQYTPAGVRPIFVQERRDSGDALNIPIVLHGQSIGGIRLKKRRGIGGEWSERERDLVEKISAQVALALENSRLVDEAQKNALRNQMIASFSTYVRETLDVEAVIRTAATEFRRVFDLNEAEILIGSSQSEEGQGRR